MVSSTAPPGGPGASSLLNLFPSIDAPYYRLAPIIDKKHPERRRTSPMSTLHSTPFPELNAVLSELVTSVQSILGDNFLAAYLQGSFAVGDFDQHSDVDFIIALNSELSQDQVAALQVMHARIFSLDCPWAHCLEGSYFPEHILRHYSRRGVKLWYLDNGHHSLILDRHCNTAVVRSVLLRDGVVLVGPAPTELVDPVPVSVLRREILETMNTWARQVLANPGMINNRFYQGFAVFHYCRSLHALHTGVVGSKRAGAEWAKTNLDPSWAELIDRAWDTRPNPSLSVRQPPDPQDFQSTLAFIEYAIKISEQYTG
jgi:hypothetical protein